MGGSGGSRGGGGGGGGGRFFRGAGDAFNNLKPDYCFYWQRVCHCYTASLTVWHGL